MKARMGAHTTNKVTRSLDHSLIDPLAHLTNVRVEHDYVIHHYFIKRTEATITRPTLLSICILGRN